MKNSLVEASIHELVEKTLSEDLQSGDITTRNIFSGTQIGVAEIISREPMILCGLDIFKAVFRKLNLETIFSSNEYNDGDEIAANAIIIKVECEVVNLLEGERSGLNILQWLSGIATLTGKYAKKAHPVKVLDTRKTTPGLRVFEKYAVKCGGGHNHRFGLYDQVLIKDNHIAAAGGISNAVTQIRKSIANGNTIEVEVKSLDEVGEALKSQVDIIMLDNMSLEMIRQAIAMIDGKTKTEISGGVTYEKLDEISKTGADFVSVGALTHSAPNIDISMNITNFK